MQQFPSAEMPSQRMITPAASTGVSEPRAPGAKTFPPLDEHLVVPETTRDEVIRGRRVLTMPALPPHADGQFTLGYVLGAHVHTGYVGSTELLTRTLVGSDFATDACIRKEGVDPTTGQRYLEELAFEVVNEQSERDIREKAQEMTTRGVCRIFAIFVKKGTVCAWSATERAWKRLEREDVIQDATLAFPMRVQALLDTVAADNAVALALEAKDNPAIRTMKIVAREQADRAREEETRKREYADRAREEETRKRERADRAREAAEAEVAQLRMLLDEKLRHS